MAGREGAGATWFIIAGSSLDVDVSISPTCVAATRQTHVRMHMYHAHTNAYTHTPVTPTYLHTYTRSSRTNTRMNARTALKPAAHHQLLSHVVTAPSECLNFVMVRTRAYRIVISFRIKVSYQLYRKTTLQPKLSTTNFGVTCLAIYFIVKKNIGKGKRT